MKNSLVTASPTLIVLRVNDVSTEAVWISRGIVASIKIVLRVKIATMACVLSAIRSARATPTAQRGRLASVASVFLGRTQITAAASTEIAPKAKPAEAVSALPSKAAAIQTTIQMERCALRMTSVLLERRVCSLKGAVAGGLISAVRVILSVPFEIAKGRVRQACVIKVSVE
jgi:hypothetical protein